MEDTMRTQLLQVGIDVDAAMERFMNNEGLLKRFLVKFLDDRNFLSLQEAVKAGDSVQAVTASHTLKGVCGNLSMTRLFGLLARQVELFRENRWEEAVAMMEELSQAYEQTCQGIRKAFP